MIKSTSDYTVLSAFYEKCLEQFGTTSKGVDWPNQKDLNKRFQVMLDVIKRNHTNKTTNILDIGCGYGALVSYLKQHDLIESIHYTGIDISDKMITAAKSLHPEHHFSTQDILKQPIPNQSYDYVIMNGLFTEKRELSWHAMHEFMRSFLMSAFKICREGIAFNVMRHHVDWSNLNLFYYSFNDMEHFLMEHCSRHFIFRSDYGLYEYTVYVYRNAN